jgi:hypothetical protein
MRSQLLPALKGLEVGFALGFQNNGLVGSQYGDLYCWHGCGRN